MRERGVILRNPAEKGITMIELSYERIDQMLHEETLKKEELKTILRCLYTRYMRMYEKYFSDIDALNDDEINELKINHEETRSLFKYYYMDIPIDICETLTEFDKKYTANLLGSDWHKYLFDLYKEFSSESSNRKKSEESLKAEFQEQCLTEFYEAMDSVFREGFDTESKTAEKVTSGLTGLLFGSKS